MTNPSNEEQLLLELINRARAQPGFEPANLLSRQANINSAVAFFGVDVEAFFLAMLEYNAAPPVAWNSNLANAADGHGQQMIAFDEQSHQLPGEPGLAQRVINAGYTGFSTVAENVYAFTDDPLFGHAGFMIDWGYDTEDFNGQSLRPNFATLGDGMQDPPGHRITIMNAAYKEVGISLIAENNPQTEVGPLVMTQVFGARFNYSAQFVGSVINDTDDDDFYDVGEGLGGVAVTLRAANGTTLSTTTWASGGYQIAAPAGTYTVTFSGGGLTAPVITQATIGTQNVYLSVEDPSGNHARHDFNGDGISDVLWRHSSGGMTTWLGGANGLTTNPAANAGAPVSWKIADDGDFNGDGRDDILWRNDNGALTFWLSNGNGFTPDSYIASIGTDWQVVGTGDFDNDGRDDILWRNANGAITSWLASGNSFSPNGDFFAVVGTDWQVTGLGDFNGDGFTDLLWRNASGAITSWLSNGTSFTPSTQFFTTVSNDWQVAETGDFNGDGNDDILWRNTNGGVTNWLSTGTSFAANSAFFATVGTDWQIVATGNYDGSVADDILWRNTNGTLTFWEAKGNGFDAAQPVYGVGTDWTVQPDLLL